MCCKDPPFQVLSVIPTPMNIIEFDTSRIHHKAIYINALCNLQGFFFIFYLYYECRDLEVLLSKYAIDDIGMHFFYVLFPLALKSLVVIPILSKYWFSKQFPFDCQCVFMTRLKSVFLRSNKSESHEAALQLIRLAIYSLNCLVWFEDQ